MKVEATLPSNSSPPPADTTTPDPIAVSTNTVDEEDISDEEQFSPVVVTDPVLVNY
jgi:hypothetical protein